MLKRSRSGIGTFAESLVHMTDSNVPTNIRSCFIIRYTGVLEWDKYVKKGNRTIYPVCVGISNQTVQVNNWQYVEDAFMRIFGISLRKANCLNVSDLEITKLK